MIAPGYRLASGIGLRRQFRGPLALRCGVVVGGLLNATFGNVVEIILSIAALQKGLYTVVSTSLLGSILSNLLLVLGERRGRERTGTGS